AYCVRGSLLFYQNFDRGEMFVVAVGVFSLHTEEIAARFLDDKRLAGAHAAFGFVVQRKATLGDDVVSEVGYSLLLRFGLADDEVADAHILFFAVRVGVGQDELKDQGLAHFGLEQRPLLDILAGRLLIDDRGVDFIFFLAR